jgi:hypothetical protein
MGWDRAIVKEIAKVYFKEVVLGSPPVKIVYSWTK